MKDKLRKEMLEKRHFLHTNGGHMHCISIMDRLVRLPEFASAKFILAYSSKGSEVHTDGIIQSALSLGKKIALPVTKKAEKKLELYEISSIAGLVEGEFGIMEPKQSPEMKVMPSKIDLAIVPGVSFDRRGHRIGYGMGYYDSLLPEIKGKKIGLAYDMQIVEHVPNEPHDIAVDMIVTESETITCGEKDGWRGKAHPSAAKIPAYRLAVLASGRGSDFQSIIDAKLRGELPNVELVGLITDNPSAQAIGRAKQGGIPAFVISYSSREELDAKIRQKLDELSPDLVVLAGYMKIVRDPFLSAYSRRIINIHPSLLPKYPGAHAQEDAFKAGERISGYTIHFVDASLDGGPIIHQEKVDISPCKSADEAAAKILEREHVGLPMIVGKFSEGKVKLQGRNVLVE